MRIVETRGRGPRLLALPRGIGKTDLRQHYQGSLGAMGGASDHADQRESVDADRAQGTRLLGGGNGEIFVRRRIFKAPGFRAQVTVANQLFDFPGQVALITGSSRGAARPYR